LINRIRKEKRKAEEKKCERNLAVQRHVITSRKIEGKKKVIFLPSRLEQKDNYVEL